MYRLRYLEQFRMGDRERQSQDEYHRVAVLLQEGLKDEARNVAEHIRNEAIRIMAKVLIERSRPLSEKRDAPNYRK
jgi:hypothetical protein